MMENPAGMINCYGIQCEATSPLPYIDDRNFDPTAIPHNASMRTTSRDRQNRMPSRGKAAASGSLPAKVAVYRIVKI
jgi:hypothetical protein